MKHVFLLFHMLFIAAGLSAQAESQDFLRSTGKIYVVVAVLAIIFIILIAYLVYLDRKLGRLEKQIRNEQKDQ